MSNVALEPTNTFVGRITELDEVAKLLRNDKRLVSITGTAGVGKTRFVMRVVPLHSEHFSTVVFCDLSQVRSSTEILVLIAKRLSLSAIGQDPIERLLSIWQMRERVLLVFDNCEHLLGELQHILTRWLSATHSLRVVITSRERLKIPEEVVVHLQPLPVPQVAQLREHSDFVATDAVNLLIDRVRSILGHYDPAPDEELLLGKIARVIDGLPLAIELIASRVAMLGASDVYQRVVHNKTHLFDRTYSKSTARKLTLNDSIALSWNTLNESEQRVLAQCTVFSDTFSIDTAAQVVDLGDHNDGVFVVDIIHTLVERSLLVLHPSDQGTSRVGPPRFGYYHAVRTFAAERLTQIDPQNITMRRCEQVYLSRCKVAAENAELHGDFHFFEVEYNHLWSMIHRALERAQTQSNQSDTTALGQALALIVSFRWFYALRGPINVYLDVLNQVLTVSAKQKLSAIDQSNYAIALAARAAFGRQQSRLEDGIVDCNEALAIARAQNHPDVVFYILRQRAGNYLYLGQTQKCVEDCQSAADLARASRKPVLLAHALMAQAVALQDTAKPTDLERWLQESLGNFRLLNNQPYMALVAWQMGEFYNKHKHYNEAVSYLREAIELAERTKSELTANWSRRTLAEVYHEQGSLTQALALYDVAVEHAKRLADTEDYHLLELQRALVWLEQGKRSEAKKAILHVRDLQRRTPGRMGQAWICDGFLAMIEALNQRFDEADELLADLQKLQSQLTEPVRLCAVIPRIFVMVQRATTFTDAQALWPTAVERLVEVLRSPYHGPQVRRLLRLLPEKLIKEASTTITHQEHNRVVQTVLNDSDALIIAKDGTWFRPPKGERVDCSQKPVLRRFLMALLQQRLQTTTTPLSAKSLVSLVWEGEKMQEKAAMNRLHVTVNKLRSMGLGQLLVYSNDGYSLDRTVDVVGV